MSDATTGPPTELTLSLRPRARYDVIDILRRIVELHGDALARYPRVLYCSHHTTAGFLDQSMTRRLLDRGRGIDPFVAAFRTLFPHQAGYHHDRVDERPELTAEQRRHEPPNADAHLTFIGSGLSSCVTYDAAIPTPPYLLELDGVHQGRFRTRTASVIGYTDEEPVATFDLDVPVSRHTIDSVNLFDRRIALRERIDHAIRRSGCEVGRVDVVLAPGEASAAVTVNEFETLLMRHDLTEVLQDPLRFMARQGRRMLEHPGAVPAKSLGYARYDVVQVLNQLIESLGLGESLVERVVAKVMALPASRMLRWRRSVSLPVSSPSGDAPRVLQGRFQSPILIQWAPCPARRRRLRVTVHRFR
jgi:thiamine phosphate synthase YjbQ (UPF0047 family)